jgi:PAS domain S-box-containing protein
MGEKPDAEITGRVGRKKPGTSTSNRRFFGMVNQSAELRTLIDKIPDAMILTDGKGRIQHLNQGAESLFGNQARKSDPVKWPEEIGLYLDDGLTPFPEHNLPVMLALQGKAKDNEEIILRRQGEKEGIWISMSAQPLEDEEGRIAGALIFARDISLRKQIEQSRSKHLQRTEALYKLSHHITEAGNNLNQLAQAVVKFISEVLGDLSLLALKESDSSQLRVSAFSDTHPTGHALMRKVLLNSDQLDEDRTLIGGVLKSGEPMLVPSIDPDRLKAITMPELSEYIDQVGVESILIVPVTGRSGVLGALGLYRHRGSEAFNMEDQSFLMDIASRTALAIENCRLFESLRLEIAERLSTKQRLDSSEERFRAIFEATSLGIKVLDLDGNLLQTNPAFQRMLGYSNAELFGRHFSDFLFQADIPQALKLIKDLKSSGVAQFLFEHRAIAKDGSLVWVRTTFSPVFTSNNGSKRMAYIVGILENVSERKRIELQMKELRDRLQSNIELERLRLAQELHDNPMQSLYSVIYRVEELRSKADPDQMEGLKKINSEIQTVIDSLRATAQELRPPTIFDFGLENAIRSYVDDFSQKHPELEISLSLAQDRQLLPENIRLALFRIVQQALMNVVRHAEATKVKIRFAFDAEEVRLEVTDNGRGFEVPSNWMEFVRSGHYGLAGASERVDSLGGMFLVASQPGNTTTVSVAIPWKEFQS